MSSKSTTNLSHNMIRYGIGTAGILLIPLVAMQFRSDVDWGPADFIIIGALLMGAGLVYELVQRNVDKKYRGVVATAVIVAVLLIWVHLAVGIVDNWPLAGS